jgi:hypothetical protein
MMFTRNIGKTLTSSFPDTGEPQTPHSNHATVAEGSLKNFRGQDSGLGVQKRRYREAGGYGTSSTPTKNRVSFDCLGAAHKIGDWPE